MKLLGRYIHGSHRRNDAPRGQRSQRLGGGAQVRCCWQCRVSIMVLIQIRSSLRPRPPTRLRRRNYTCRIRLGTTRGISETRLGTLRGSVSDAVGEAQQPATPPVNP